QWIDHEIARCRRSDARDSRTGFASRAAERNGPSSARERDRSHLAKRVPKILGGHGGMMRARFLFLGILLVTVVQLFADEATRRAQEELRKRNLYFGDINGQSNPEFTEALKDYQMRKGFNANRE